MNIRLLLFVSAITWMLGSCASSSSTSSGGSAKSEMTIAFGSCNHPEDPQSIWKTVKKSKPNLWMWTGDIIYADTEVMSEMKADYDTQLNNPDYKDFITDTKVIGIWDDHDYGANNAGVEYPMKDSSKLLLFDFLNVAADHPSREHAGAYQSYTYTEGDLKVKVLLLDARYFREAPNAPNSTVLGNEQWRWLINHLSTNEADVHVIVSGIQILPTEHDYEKWANFKPERERLLNILDQLQVNNPIFISGDRHIGEMTLQSLPQSGDPILEVTSSGLTHYYKDFSGEKNSYRFGTPVAALNFGVLQIKKKDGVVTFEAEIKDANNKSRLSIASTSLDYELGQIEARVVKSAVKG